MYRIGLFSKMNRVTIKTLRYYDEQNLLKPAFVDEETGYRYYSSQQIPRLHQIIFLKQLGLSIKQIKAVLIEEKAVEDILNQQKQKLLSQLQETTQQLAQIENFIYSEKRIETNQIIVKELPAVQVIAYRKTIANHQELFHIMSYLQTIFATEKVSATEPMYCFSIYHDGEYKEKDIDVEVCEAIVSAYEGKSATGKFITSVPKAACILHQGTYATLHFSYAKVIDWVQQHDYQIAGDIRESYIDGIWNQADANQWLTEIQVPISKKSE